MSVRPCIGALQALIACTRIVYYDMGSGPTTLATSITITTDRSICQCITNGSVIAKYAVLLVIEHLGYHSSD